MQIKATIRLNLTAISIAKNKTPQVIAHDYKDVEIEEHSSIVAGLAKWYNHSGNQSGGSSKNWK